MRRRAVCLVACFAALALGAPALALVTSQVGSTDLLGHQTGGYIPADCPPGTTALGAGLDSDNPNVMSVAEIAPHFFGIPLGDRDPGSYPAIEDWYASFSNDGNDPHPIAVATLCNEGGRTIEIDALTAPAYSVGAARVLCPAGSLAVGGGVSFAPSAPVTSSGPVLDDGTPDGARLIDFEPGEAPAPIGWRSTLGNRNGLSIDERAAAVCDPAVANLVTVIARTTVPESATASNRVLCAPGHVALGGGVDVTDAMSLVVTATAPVFDNGTSSGERLLNRPNGANPAPIGWLGAARNEDTIAHTLMIGVICPEPSSAAGAISASTFVAALAARSKRAPKRAERPRCMGPAD